MKKRIVDINEELKDRFGIEISLNRLRNYSFQKVTDGPSSYTGTGGADHGRLGLYPKTLAVQVAAVVFLNKMHKPKYTLERIAAVRTHLTTDHGPKTLDNAAMGNEGETFTVIAELIERFESAILQLAGEEVKLGIDEAFYLIALLMVSRIECPTIFEKLPAVFTNRANHLIAYHRRQKREGKAKNEAKG